MAWVVCDLRVDDGDFLLEFLSSVPEAILDGANAGAEYFGGLGQGEMLVVVKLNRLPETLFQLIDQGKNVFGHVLLLKLVEGRALVWLNLPPASFPLGSPGALANPVDVDMIGDSVEPTGEVFN